MNKLLVKMAILSVSLLTIMAGAAISPALGNIAEAFPEASETTIKLLLTLPSVMIIPFIYVSSYLTSSFPKKNILFVGMLFYLIGGLGGGFVPTIEILLVFRAILGIGVGLMMPISTSLVADFFDGDERTATMGQVSAANNLGGVMLFIMSGVLAGFNWRVAFYVYALVFVSGIIVYFFLPKRKPEVFSATSEKKKLPKRVYGYGLSMLLIVLAFYSIPTNIALFMHQEGIGQAQQAGIVIAVGTAAGFVAGLVMWRLNKLLKSYFVMVNLIVMGCGFFTISYSYHVIMLGIGVGLMGFGFGSIVPTVFDQVSRQVPRSQTVQAMAVVTSMLFFGQFSSPIILDAIGYLFANSSIQFTYQFLGWCTFLIAIGFAVKVVRPKREKEQSLAS